MHRPTGKLHCTPITGGWVRWDAGLKWARSIDLLYRIHTHTLSRAK